MKSLFLIVVAIVLQACAVSPNAILKKEELPSGDFLATDSRLRVIFNVEQGIFSTTGLVEPHRIICTEPSPDVATTIANSMGVAASVLQYGSGSLSMQQTEGLVQLGERTAAIQLLRDKMYQSCLSYANGAITGTTYSLLMSRLDDTIVTLSLGDKAAGAFGGKLAAIGGKASAKAEATLIGLPGEISKIADQAKNLAAANKKVDDAETALQANKASKPETGKEKEFEAQTAKLDKDVQDAKAERNALLELMRSTAKSASEASGEIVNLQAGGGFTAKPEAGVLHQMQADFLQPNVNRDLAFACMVELGQRDPRASNPAIEAVREDSRQKDYQHLISYFQKKTDNPPDYFWGDKIGRGKAAKQSEKNYVSAILHTRSTSLEIWCNENLKSIIAAEQSADERRIERARINADLERAKINADLERAKLDADKANVITKDRESLLKLIDKCQTDFKSDEKRRNACLAIALPTKPDTSTPTLSGPATTPTGQKKPGE